MRALCMVMSHVLADEFSQVRLTQRDDAVEAFLFDREALESRKLSDDRVSAHYALTYSS